VHSDRILQRSQVVELVNRATWIGTGNNPHLSNQLLRRTIQIRIVSPHADPTQATGFRHANLDDWIQEHRNEFIAHILTIICGWVNAGKRKFSGTPLASYVSWSEIIGGILEFVRVPGFLEDADEKAALAIVTDDLAPAFIADWFNAYGEQLMSPKEIGNSFGDGEIAVLWDSHTELGRATKVGNYLRGIKDRIYEVATPLGKCNVKVTLRGRKWQLQAMKA